MLACQNEPGGAIAGDPNCKRSAHWKTRNALSGKIGSYHSQVLDVDHASGLTKKLAEDYKTDAADIADREYHRPAQATRGPASKLQLCAGRNRLSAQAREPSGS
jgi:hypothetical protein